MTAQYQQETFGAGGDMACKGVGQLASGWPKEVKFNIFHLRDYPLKSGGGVQKWGWGPKPWSAEIEGKGYRSPCSPIIEEIKEKITLVEQQQTI